MKINIIIRNTLFLLILTLLTGCGKKQINYQGGSAADTILGEELVIPDSCKMDIESGNSALTSVTIDCDSIVVPDVDAMYMSPCEIISGDDSAFKQEVATALFDVDKGIYVFDVENQPKEYYERLIEIYAGQIDLAAKYGALDVVEWLETSIAEMETAMQESSEEKNMVDGYTADRYIGFIGDREYILEFNGENDIYPSFNLSLYPDLLYYRPYEGAFRCSRGVIDDSVTAENLCEMTQDQAEKRAVEFLTDWGFTDVVLSDTVYSLTWDYYNVLGEYVTWDCDGYVFSFLKSFNGVKVFNDSLYAVENIREGSDNIFYDMPTIRYSICINDDGIAYANGTSLVKDTGDRELVQLLSWEEVIDALQTGLPEYYMTYPTNDKSITYDHVELTYAILKDGEDTGKFMYTPVWVFTEWDRYSYDENSVVVAPIQIIMVNAVDGSIVDIKEEALNYEKYIVNPYYYSAE